MFSGWLSSTKPEPVSQPVEESPEEVVERISAHEALNAQIAKHFSEDAVRSMEEITSRIDLQNAVRSSIPAFSVSRHAEGKEKDCDICRILGPLFLESQRLSRAMLIKMDISPSAHTSELAKRFCYLAMRFCSSACTTSKTYKLFADDMRTWTGDCEKDINSLVRPQ